MDHLVRIQTNILINQNYEKILQIWLVTTRPNVNCVRQITLHYIFIRQFSDQVIFLLSSILAFIQQILL